MSLEAEGGFGVQDGCYFWLEDGDALAPLIEALRLTHLKWCRKCMNAKESAAGGMSSELKKWYPNLWESGSAVSVNTIF